MASTPDTAARLAETVAFLEALAENRSLLADIPEADRVRLLTVAGRVCRPDAVQRRRLRKAMSKRKNAERIQQDETVLHQTGIRALRRLSVFTTPNQGEPPPLPGDLPEDDPDARELLEPQNCYVCKKDYQVPHPFYDQLCPECGDFNYQKRGELADLSGHTALLTGGRVKIGYQAGIKLLRCGANLIVTTRFPRDAAARFARESDFGEWGHRVEVFGLDLRHTPSVEAFCKHLLDTRDRLDFIINNACQTVRRPPDFYKHMMALESGSAEALPEKAKALLGHYEGLRRYDMLPEGKAPERKLAELAGLARAAELSQVPLLPEDHAGSGELFPEGRLDQDLQQVDLRERNSWRLQMPEVSAVELLEVHLVNAVAPFLLNARLKPLLMRGPGRRKHVVNVSAVEGQFYRRFKTTRHPHTNMAKASLNMMTRTAAAEYWADGIHMNSVDTGWVTDEDPAALAERKTREQRFHPPLDIVDGAARIVDPIIAGFNTGVHVWGKFLKDYKETPW